MPVIVVCHAQPVQLDIRKGHAQTVDRVLGWLDLLDAACFSFSPPNTFVLCTLQQVQLDIRTGHAQTVEKVLGWLDEEGGIKGTTVCDCGCGTGSLAVPLALRVRLKTSVSLRFLTRSSRRMQDNRGGQGDQAPQQVQRLKLDSCGALQQVRTGDILGSPLRGQAPRFRGATRHARLASHLYHAR